MTRAFSALLVLAGVAAMLLGLLFVVGAGDHLHRYLVAGVGLALGAVAVGWGVRLFRRAEASSPEAIRAAILALAKAHDGELSADEIAARLGRRADAARAILDELTREGICRREMRASGAPRFIFPELQPRMIVRRCEFCQAELPLAEEVATCPRCGGSVRTQRESRPASASDDLYRMDD